MDAQDGQDIRDSPLSTDYVSADNAEGFIYHGGHRGFLVGLPGSRDMGLEGSETVGVSYWYIYSNTRYPAMARGKSHLEGFQMEGFQIRCSNRQVTGLGFPPARE